MLAVERQKVTDAMKAKRYLERQLQDEKRKLQEKEKMLNALEEKYAGDGQTRQFGRHESRRSVENFERESREDDRGDARKRRAVESERGVIAQNALGEEEAGR